MVILYLAWNQELKHVLSQSSRMRRSFLVSIKQRQKALGWMTERAGCISILEDLHSIILYMVAINKGKRMD